MKLPAQLLGSVTYCSRQAATRGIEGGRCSIRGQLGSYRPGSFISTLGKEKKPNPKPQKRNQIEFKGT